MLRRSGRWMGRWTGVDAAAAAADQAGRTHLCLAGYSRCRFWFWCRHDRRRTGFPCWSRSVAAAKSWLWWLDFRFLLGCASYKGPYLLWPQHYWSLEYNKLMKSPNTGTQPNKPDISRELPLFKKLVFCAEPPNPAAVPPAFCFMACSFASSRSKSSSQLEGPDLIIGISSIGFDGAGEGAVHTLRKQRLHSPDLPHSACQRVFSF